MLLIWRNIRIKYTTATKAKHYDTNIYSQLQK